MQFIDLKTQQERIRENIDRRIREVLDHGKYIMGPEIQELETGLAEYVGVRYCISCSSGTDALLIPLMAWGIGPGDAVFTTPFTFIATAEVIQLLGGTPVFVDIEKDTFNIDPSRLDSAIRNVIQEKKIRPRCIIPVDLFGLPANYPQIQKVADKYGLKILEDGAQGFGGSIGNRKACSFGEVASTSFFPAKPLGCYGDGGAIFTNDPDLASVMDSIRVHGKGSDKYDNIRIGINGRMDTIQAAIVLAKMEIFDDEVKKRNLVAAEYNRRLKGVHSTQKIPDGYESVWAQFSILADDSTHRQQLLQKLKDKGIPGAVYYPLSLHRQKAFEHLGYQQNDFPVSESVSQRIFSVPMHPYLDEYSIFEICNTLTV